MRRFRSHFAVMAAVYAVVAVLGSFGAQADDDPWPSLRKDIFQDRPVQESSDIQIFAPAQADDAAVVPVSVNLASKIIPSIKSLTLMIDRNPAPVAATFAFADAFRAHADVGERTISARIRVDAFSRVRAVAELTDGRLLMASRFVVGSGGCSAPASKDMESSLAQLGRAKLKVTKSDGRSEKWREAQLMIKHPNFTGMQMNKNTGNYTPARFINFIEVKQGDAVLLRMEGGISISEDPNIRFTFGTADAADLEFSAKDTSGGTFGASSKPGS